MNALFPSARRSLLFVPGIRADRFDKARASGADVVCIDLEDAVPLGEKERARQLVLEFLGQRASSNTEWALRINSPRSLEGMRDIIALHASGVQPGLLLLPKVQSPQELATVHEALGARALPMVALLESAMGIEHAFAIASAPGLVGLMLGGADYVAELGGVMDRHSLSYPRSRTVAAAASRGLFSIDVPFLDIVDSAGLRDECVLVRDLGFTCKSAIHPAQIATIHTVMTPSQEAVAKAKKILAAMAAQDQAAIQVDGALVDRPILLQAERVLRQAGASMD